MSLNPGQAPAQRRSTISSRFSGEVTSKARESNILTSASNPSKEQDEKSERRVIPQPKEAGMPEFLEYCASQLDAKALDAFTNFCNDPALDINILSVVRMFVDEIDVALAIREEEEVDPCDIYETPDRYTGVGTDDPEAMTAAEEREYYEYPDDWHGYDEHEPEIFSDDERFDEFDEPDDDTDREISLYY
jgi:hypothetical protein